MIMIMMMTSNYDYHHDFSLIFIMIMILFVVINTIIIMSDYFKHYNISSMHSYMQNVIYTF